MYTRHVGQLTTASSLRLGPRLRRARGCRRSRARLDGQSGRLRFDARRIDRYSGSCARPANSSSPSSPSSLPSGDALTRLRVDEKRAESANGPPPSMLGARRIVASESARPRDRSGGAACSCDPRSSANREPCRTARAAACSSCASRSTGETGESASMSAVDSATLSSVLLVRAELLVRCEPTRDSRRESVPTIDGPRSADLRCSARRCRSSSRHRRRVCRVSRARAVDVPPGRAAPLRPAGTTPPPSRSPRPACRAWPCATAVTASERDACRALSPTARAIPPARAASSPRCRARRSVASRTAA